MFGTDAGEKFITAESVYAVFESKPSINKDTFEYANKKINSVVKLERTRRKVINAGKECKPRELTKIIGRILAVDSIDLKTIEEHLENYDKIDVGCAIKKHFFLVNRDGNGISLSSATDKEIVLAFFYML